MWHQLSRCPLKTRSATSRPSRRSAKQRTPPRSPPLATLSDTVSTGCSPSLSARVYPCLCGAEGIHPMHRCQMARWAVPPPGLLLPSSRLVPGGGSRSARGSTRILALNRIAGSREQQTLQMNLTVLQRMDNCIVEILDMAGQVCAATLTQPASPPAARVCPWPTTCGHRASSLPAALTGRRVPLRSGPAVAEARHRGSAPPNLSTSSA